MAFLHKFKHHSRCILGNTARHFLHTGCVLFLCMLEKLTSPGGPQRNSAPMVRVFDTDLHTTKEEKHQKRLENLRPLLET